VEFRKITDATGEAIAIELVALSELEKLDGVLWERNAKKHDLDRIWESIERHGFIDPPKYDRNLNNGRGGLVFGNGRIEALIGGLIRAREAGKEPPRGIAIASDGEWCIPVKHFFGSRYTVCCRLDISTCCQLPNTERSTATVWACV
jgi:hypothetical protein